MIVIPSMDISDGLVVGRRHGPKASWPVYSDDPAAVAERWQQEGAKILHVADMDEPVKGEPASLPVLQCITDAVRIPVEFSSAAATVEAARKVLNAGARWAVLRQEAVDDDVLAAAVQGLRRRLIVAVAGSGAGLSDSVAARALEAAGVERLIVRDATADGALSGPNMAMLRGVVEAVSVPVIAAGGVASLEDVRAVREAGLLGVIVGRALYDGALDLGEAMAAAK